MYGARGIPMIRKIADTVRKGLEDRPTVYIASDSLAQTYAGGDRPQTGWGECIARYLGSGPCVISHADGFDFPAAMRYDCPDIAVVNASMAARSTKTYIEEGKLDQILAEISKGDVLLIQFAANDATKARPQRYTTPVQFVENLGRFVDGAMKRGAVPLILTPTPRCNFSADGHYRADFEEYAFVERKFCREKGVGLTDLSDIGGRYMEELGELRARALYMKLSAGLYPAYPDGLDDATHLSYLGARTYARMIAREAVTLAPQLSFHDDDDSSFTGRIEGIEARVDEDASAVVLSWDRAASADCYTISCDKGGQSFVGVSLEPRFMDAAVPDQSADIRYEIRAWHRDASGEPGTVEMEHEFALSSKREARISGFNLYEIDQTVADRISFSVRFSPFEGVQKYRVLARNAQSGQIRILDSIPASDIGLLHGYFVTREPGWRVHVEGDLGGTTCTSEECEVPCSPLSADSRPSWEAGF